MTTIATPNINSILTALDKSSKTTNDEWMQSLTKRKIAELEFHDEWREGNADVATDTFEELHANVKYYATVQQSCDYFRNWIATHAKDKVVLDYACGNGDYTIQAASAGASLAVGLDISRISVENGKNRAAREGVSDNTYFLQGDCENTGIPSNSVDVIICSGMLHHLDLSHAFPEMRRIMKPGGICLAYEALDYNPIIKLYRLLTPRLRTDWEKKHILSLADLKFARRFFDVTNVKYWHLFSILTTPIRNTMLFKPTLKVANVIDKIALKIFPLSLMAWMFTFELRKRMDA